MRWSMQQKSECVENRIALKSVTASWRHYLREYWSLTTSTNSLRVWLHGLQDLGRVAGRPRSGCPLISNDDFTVVENVFQENPTKFLTVASPELLILFSKIRSAFRAKLKMFPCKRSFLRRTPLGRLSFATWLCNDYSSWIEHWFWIPGKNFLHWWIHLSYQWSGQQAWWSSLTRRDPVLSKRYQ